MALKNYTTTITVEKTIMEIEMILSKFGATHIMKLYENGVPKGLAFQLEIQNNIIPFKLPMKEEKILILFNKQNKKRELHNKYNNIEQARRVGWRIIKDWLSSQLALIEIDLARPEEIFLPYMYDAQTNLTLFEKFEKKGFQNLLTYEK